MKTTAPKIGRPKVADPNNKRTGVCLNQKTMEALEDYCKEHKITKGEAIRRGIVLLLKEEEK